MIRMYNFTNKWVQGPISGEMFPAPETTNGHIAIPYRDNGYMGGIYWAIVPEDWNIEEAARVFAQDGHMTTLQSVGEIEVPYALQNELWGE